MKKYLTLFALLLSFLASQAETVVVDGIKYSLSGTSASVVAYDSSDDYANNGQYYFGEIEIPDSIIYNGASRAVTSIERNAFKNCGQLTSLIIPQSIGRIEDCAFSNCTGLKKLVIANSDKTLNLGIGDVKEPLVFFQKEGLFSSAPIEELYLGRNLSYTYGQNGSWTNYGPFEYSQQLQKVTLSDKVTILGGRIFKDCPEEIVIDVPTSIKEIKDDAFTNSWALLKFNDTIPLTIGESFTGHNLLLVADSLYSKYYNAWTNYQGQIITDAYPLAYDIQVEAKLSDSDVLCKVLDGGSSSKVLNVLDLKVTGTINSYDIMVLRNKILNLRNLDLSEADIVYSSYQYYTGYNTNDSIIGPFSFCNLENLRTIKLPNSVKTISASSFTNCSNLEKLV